MGKYFTNESAPTDTIDMTWDANGRRWLLKIETIDNEYAISFLEFAGSEGNASSLIREIGSDLKKFIFKYNRRDETKRRVDEYRYAKDEDIRDIIRDAMLSMIRALIRSGFTLQKDLSWVNPETNTVLDLSNIPDIAPDAADDLFAYGVLHKGPYTFRISDEDYRSDY